MSLSFIRKITDTLICAVLICSCGCVKKNPMHRTKTVLMGTYITILSPDKSAAADAIAEIKRLEKIFNFYDPDSDASRLKRSSGEPVKVSPEFIELLYLAVDSYNFTSGCFDVFQGKLYAYWKKLINSGVTSGPDKEFIRSLIISEPLKKIRIDRDDSTVTVKDISEHLDLSGIAKGFITDKAAQVLRAKGYRDFLIDSGGDILTSGANKNTPWTIGLREPGEQKRYLMPIRLEPNNNAVATSGNYEQKVIINGHTYSHIIDPRTGMPADNGLVSVTVLAPNLSTADAMATGLFVMGLDGIKNFLENKQITLKIICLVRTANGLEIHEF